MPEDQKQQVPELEQIFSTQGIPFKSEQAARTARTQKGLDPAQFRIQPHEGGYIIVRRPPRVKEKYYRVQFNHKSNPNDEEDVTLAVNGEVLVIQRGVPVIIPGRFKECADHATYPHFEQKPNQARKVIGTVMVFPYSLQGEATEEQYLAQLKEGNRKTKEALAAATKLID